MPAEPDPPAGPRPSRESPWVIAGQLTAVAFELTGAIAAGCLAGWWIDGWLGSDPWGLIGGALLGSTAGLYRMIRILRHFESRLR